MKTLILITLVLNSFSVYSQDFEPARNLIDTKSSRQGLIFLGAEFRYLSLFTKDFSFEPGGPKGSYQQDAFAFGGHGEFFLDRKEEIPFSLIISALYQQADILGSDVPFPKAQANTITSQSILTEASVAYFILGSDISVTAGIGAGFSLGLSTSNKEHQEVLDQIDSGTSLYLPLSVRYSYSLFSIDGFIGFCYNPYITPMLENTESQSSFGASISVRNPFRINY